MQCTATMPITSRLRGPSCGGTEGAGCTLTAGGRAAGRGLGCRQRLALRQEEPEHPRISPRAEPPGETPQRVKSRGPTAHQRPRGIVRCVLSAPSGRRGCELPYQDAGILQSQGQPQQPRADVPLQEVDQGLVPPEGGEMPRSPRGRNTHPEHADAALGAAPGPNAAP